MEDIEMNYKRYKGLSYNDLFAVIMMRAYLSDGLLSDVLLPGIKRFAKEFAVDRVGLPLNFNEIGKKDLFDNRLVATQTALALMNREERIDIESACAVKFEELIEEALRKVPVEEREEMEPALRASFDMIRELLDIMETDMKALGVDPIEEAERWVTAVKSIASENEQHPTSVAFNDNALKAIVTKAYTKEQLRDLLTAMVKVTCSAKYLVQLCVMPTFTLLAKANDETDEAIAKYKDDFVEKAADLSQEILITTLGQTTLIVDKFFE